MSLSENDKRVLRLIKVGAENSITGGRNQSDNQANRKNSTRHHQAPSSQA